MPVIDWALSLRPRSLFIVTTASKKKTLSFSKHTNSPFLSTLNDDYLPHHIRSSNAVAPPQRIILRRLQLPVLSSILLPHLTRDASFSLIHHLKSNLILISDSVPLRQRTLCICLSTPATSFSFDSTPSSSRRHLSIIITPPLIHHHLRPRSTANQLRFERVNRKPERSLNRRYSAGCDTTHMLNQRFRVQPVYFMLDCKGILNSFSFSSKKVTFSLGHLFELVCKLGQEFVESIALLGRGLISFYKWFKANGISFDK
ncbi:unnamed protein product [Vicia faba]|uniref:Uncharacterized protein n=1 Tax=Vicia faba TaxID=3906 RepID=A0AAV0ZHU0_VICFA|nr:unnamed protein product [Vicia faba]